MILAHRDYTGQLNVPDMFTRLLFSLVTTGIAPSTFYAHDSSGGRPRARYDGLTVGFLAESIAAIGTRDAPVETPAAIMREGSISGRVTR